MPRTISQLAAAVREVIQDRYTPFRYSNSELAISVNEGMAEARRLRPDLFLGALSAGLPYYTANDFAEALPLPDEYFSAMVSYVAGRTNLRDDEFSADGRAAILIGTFAEAMTGGRRK